MKIKQSLTILLAFSLLLGSALAKSSKKYIAFIHSYDIKKHVITDIIVKDKSTLIRKEVKDIDKEKGSEYKDALKEYVKLKKAGVKDATPEQLAKALGKDDGDKAQKENGQPAVRSITTRFGGSRGNLSEEDFGGGDEKKFAIKPFKPKTTLSKIYSFKASEEAELLAALDEVYVDEELNVDKKFKTIALAYQKFLAKLKK